MTLSEAQNLFEFIALIVRIFATRTRSVNQICEVSKSRYRVYKKNRNKQSYFFKIPINFLSLVSSHDVDSSFLQFLNPFFTKMLNFVLIFFDNFDVFIGFIVTSWYSEILGNVHRKDLFSLPSIVQKNSPLTKVLWDLFFRISLRGYSNSIKIWRPVHPKHSWLRKHFDMWWSNPYLLIFLRRGTHVWN